MISNENDTNDNNHDDVNYVTLHGKPYFVFCRRPEKMVFPKKLRWNMIFLVLSGKMVFPFPENMTYTFRQKMKDDLS